MGLSSKLWYVVFVVGGFWVNGMGEGRGLERHFYQRNLSDRASDELCYK